MNIAENIISFLCALLMTLLTIHLAQLHINYHHLQETIKQKQENQPTFQNTCIVEKDLSASNSLSP